MYGDTPCSRALPYGLVLRRTGMLRAVGQSILFTIALLTALATVGTKYVRATLSAEKTSCSSRNYLAGDPREALARPAQKRMAFRGCAQQYRSDRGIYAQLQQYMYEPQQTITQYFVTVPAPLGPKKIALPATCRTMQFAAATVGQAQHGRIICLSLSRLMKISSRARHTRTLRSARQTLVRTTTGSVAENFAGVRAFTVCSDNGDCGAGAFRGEPIYVRAKWAETAGLREFALDNNTGVRHFQAACQRMVGFAAYISVSQRAIYGLVPATDGIAASAAREIENDRRANRNEKSRQN